MELRIREVDIEAGAKFKGSNGVVAVGLPHRNYSVFKQTPYQTRESKRKNKKKAWGEHQRIYIRRSIRKGGLTVIEKRVGSRGKKVKEKQKPMDCVPWVSC